MAHSSYRQFCPVAMAAEILCRRWMMLVIRELMAGTTRFNDLRRGVQHTLAIALIASAAWLLAQVFLFFVDSGTKRYKLTESDSFSARKARTQLQIIRRLVVAVIVIFALGAILMTFDEVRAVGASVLASAGVASIVAGLAAQSILGNLFAGVQLAFSEAIRVGDVVVVQGEWGKIREITLSYVVLEVWDQRTLVLPCTYFTTTPFENWTKLGKALLGTVYFDLDWRVDVDGMGLDSEWSADVRVRGTTDDMRIGGEANLIRGDYTFAGARFEVTRGRIEFDQTEAIDPRLDIQAETDADGVNVEFRSDAVTDEVSQHHGSRRRLRNREPDPC